MRVPLFTFLLLLLTLPLKSIAAEHWIRLTTPHFVMYTTNGEKSATAALQVFERARYFFLQSSPSKTAPSAPVTIVAFRSQKEFQPYRLNEGSFAYYFRSAQGDYIVMQDLSSEHYQAVMHEYTHLIVEHHDLKLPIWLNEGMADLYSSLEAKGNQAVVGRPLENSVLLLRSQSWLDLKTLFAVDHDSPYYNEANKMSIFYAESWALTHMLELGKTYRPNFVAFLTQVSAGQPVPAVLQSVYGKTTEQVFQDLHSYLNQSVIQAAVFDIKLPKSDTDPDVSDPSDLQVQLTLADLLASQPRTQSQAEQTLNQLALAHPESPDVQESLGYLAWSQGHPDKARAAFKLAAEHGSKNPQMYLNYSQISLQSGVPAADVLPILDTAVTLKPDFEEAWLDLGLAATQANQFGRALGAFSHLKNVTPAQASNLFSAQAYCYLRMNALTQARDCATRAKTYAKTPDQTASAARLLTEIDQLEHPSAHAPALAEDLSPAPERPTLKHAPRQLAPDQPMLNYPEGIQHVEATLKSIDCTGPHNRMHVLTDSKELVLEFDDPDKVVIRNTASGIISLSCGPQKPSKIGVFYIPGTASGPITGLIRELVF